MRKKWILTCTCMIAIFLMGCESRAALYQVTETKRDQEIKELNQEMDYQPTMESITNSYMRKEEALDVIGDEKGYKKLDAATHQALREAMDVYICGFYSFSYAYLPEEPTHLAYETMTPALAAQVKQSGRLAAWQEALKEHHVVVTIPEAVRIPEGYVEESEQDGQTIHRAYALVKLTTNGDAAYYRENPHFTLGDTLVVLWMDYNADLQLMQYSETYLMNEGNKTIYYTPEGVYEKEE